MMYYQRFSANTKKLLPLLVSVSLAVLLLFMPATCAASETQEPMYRITEAELTTLENNLARLKAINTQLQTESSTQKEQSVILLKQVTLLQDQLRMLREQSLKQEELLTIANKSLEEYASAEKKKRLKIKAQRNGWAAASILLAGIAFVK